ncbi:MAG: iron ABC transporter permease [Desulfobacteraceae bacterium]|nr:iron ABC transporter permease [Desulfobacteraceae bacterium]
MTVERPHLLRRLLLSGAVLGGVLLIAAYIGLAAGSTSGGIMDVWKSLGEDPQARLLRDIIWRLRLPRVLMAGLVGATLSLGGMVFQVLLRNPLAEPYILGVSGGSAIGAIVGILMGLSRIPGVWLTSFAGSLAVLGVLFVMAGGRAFARSYPLLLSGVMVNAFCAAVIMFLVSMAQDSRLHDIIYWLMGDLAASTLDMVLALAAAVLPCFVLIFTRSHAMNLLALGSDMARSMGVNLTATMVLLLVVTSLMVSATVSYCGLIGFVGLVIPHMLRLMLGPDHRVLTPACILGGAAFMVVCDVLARTLPAQGEMPVGVISAIIGAPLFIYLLRKSQGK